MFLASQTYKIAPVAQWIEHLTSDQRVARSNRAGGALEIRIETKGVGIPGLVQSRTQLILINCSDIVGITVTI